MYIEGWVVKDLRVYRLFVDESLLVDAVTEFVLWYGDEVYSGLD
jgi:hypothetical protein